jgi:hypothetical protein
MQKLIMLITLATLTGVSQFAVSGESQNPHDAVNQPVDDESQNPHDVVNQPGGGDVGLEAGAGGGGVNPNSLGRTGRIDQLNDTQNTRRNTGVQTLPENTGNIDDRIEDINDDDRALRDRLDGSPTPTADPSLNSDSEGAPIPPGQGPAVNSDGTGTSDTSGTGTGDATSTISAPSPGGPTGSVTSGTSSSTSGTGTTGGTAGGTSSSSSGGGQ